MAVEILAENVPHAYSEAMWAMRINGVTENSRNGKVLTIQDAVELTILNPKERVLFDEVRDANPFFHVMEFVWLMSGSKHLAWIERFNRGFAKYSDDDKTLPASYGYRWRNHFGHDQIRCVIDHLRNDPSSRRAVLAMWDPREDQSATARLGADRPCNTHVYFRVVEAKVNMTVLNRSNDLIWGLLGANCVHMSFLHELVAHGIGLSLGEYRTYTNNLHIYEDLPKMKEMLSTIDKVDPYNKLRPISLLQPHEEVEWFIKDCEELVEMGSGVARTLRARTNWVRTVAFPMYLGYLNKDYRDKYIEMIEAPDWKVACYEWAQRRAK